MSQRNVYIISEHESPKLFKCLQVAPEGTAWLTCRCVTGVPAVVMLPLLPLYGGGELAMGRRHRHGPLPAGLPLLRGAHTPRVVSALGRPVLTASRRVAVLPSGVGVCGVTPGSVAGVLCWVPAEVVGTQVDGGACSALGPQLAGFP